MRTRTLRLELPLPPGVNNQYVTVGRRRVLSKEARAFKKDVTVIIRDKLERGALAEDWLVALRERPLACDLVFWFETPFRRDLDGGLKIALDAVCDLLDLDDRYIVSLTLEKRVDPLHPRLELELGVVDDWQFDREYVVLSDEES